MKAVVYEDTRRVGVQQVTDASIEDPGDVVIRVTSSAICGTDLHMYDGRTGAERGLVLAARTGRCGCAGRACSTRACRCTSAVPTTAATPPGCGTWSWPAAPARAGSSPTHGGLDDAPDLYERFDRRADGVIKAVLRPS
jgi:threonine dehydrogenase-like Zn-dependent dehydrogenase